MMMGEFITLVQAGLNVKVIVLNNGTLGFIEMEMKASGFLDTGCELKNPNFAAMAEAMVKATTATARGMRPGGAARRQSATAAPTVATMQAAR